MKVRRAELKDLEDLVEFTAAEAREAEGHSKDTKTLINGIKAALEDRSIAMYWVLMNQNNEPVGSASALKEWSDWSAGYYWWIQSMYIKPDYRGKRYMDLLLNAIKSEMKGQAGLKLRLYIVRRATSDDSDALFQMHQRLSKETLYFRYLSVHRPTVAGMTMVCGLSGSEGAALVVQRNDIEKTIVGLAYYRFDPNHLDENPEFAIVVEDRFQGRGIGKALLKHLCRHASDAGIRQLNASIHSQNRRMRNLLYRTDYPFDERIEFDTVEATVDLQRDKAINNNGFFNHRRLADPFAGLYF